MLSLFSLVTPLVLLTSAPLSSATPTSPLGALVSDVVGGVITTVVSPVLDLLADPPPTFIQTLTPSPQCATSVGGNGGELLCCIASVAGDNQIIEFVAKLYGYNLNPNDVNGLDCKFLQLLT